MLICSADALDDLKGLCFWIAFAPTQRYRSNNVFLQTYIHMYRQIMHKYVYVSIPACMYMSQGCGLLENKVFCLWSGHFTSTDRDNEDWTFLYIYSTTQIWSAEDGYTVYRMVFTHIIYILNNKIKHLVHQFNMHFKQPLGILSQIEHLQYHNIIIIIK